MPTITQTLDVVDEYLAALNTPEVKIYKPSFLHKIGLCFKARKGYTCHGHQGECK